MGLVLNDIHSHIIPKIDDGSESMELSVSMLKEMEHYGTKNLILTPHFSQRRGFTPSKEEISAAYNELKKECEQNEIGINLYIGNEIDYSDDVPALLSEKRLFTLAGSDYVLTEFAPNVMPGDITYAVRNIINIGYIPVVAHVERYNCVKNNNELVGTLKSLGALIQVNIASVIHTGFLGRALIKHIFKNELADFVSGDIHWSAFNDEQIEKCFYRIKKYSSESYAEDVFFNNAEKLLLNI